jgi:glycosyltransferase involved in cell wall biosynthesis
MVQAMTAGKAVIISQTFSTQEMIVPGFNGLLVPPGNPQALRQAILDLLENPELVKRLGQAARQYYQEHWSFPVVARQIDELIQQTISQRN